MVAVQTADGTRVQSTFHSSTSLWDVLCQHKFDSSPDGTEPSLMYMRQEVGPQTVNTIHMNTYACTHTCTHTHAHIHAHIHMHTYMHTYTCTHTHAHIHTHACVS